MRISSDAQSGSSNVAPGPAPSPSPGNFLEKVAYYCKLLPQELLRGDIAICVLRNQGYTSSLRWPLALQLFICCLPDLGSREHNPFRPKGQNVGVILNCSFSV